ncbi:heme-binding protein [Marinobacter sp.]|uniref:heme-binding protein n=1 Tax=Marinobacter sp. TaxID=50741 RepID=UPI003A9472C4
MTSLKRLSVLLSFLLTACGGGSGEFDPAAGAVPLGGCDGSCVITEQGGNPDNVRLTVNDVETVIAQGVAEADARGIDATLAVVDRVGNVLGVWRTGTTGMPRDVLIASSPDGTGGSEIMGGLEGIEAGIDGLAAIAKAITGAYLSSEGNAFSTRTASQIVQEHFNPGEFFQPAGPLFGVQFSQLACSDFSQRFNSFGPSIGPHRSPLGLSADPGGLPLYKNGTVIGGVGVIADDLYSLDRNVIDNDRSNQNANVDELIALAASFGFVAPVERRANRIAIEGKTLRFVDGDASELQSNPDSAPAFPPANGQLVAVAGYTGATIQPGLVFGSPASGIRPADSGKSDEAPYVGDDGYVFVDSANNNRYPATAGAQPVADRLLASEVEVLMQEALRVANKARAQIRRPHGSQARVTISVVDTDGNILGMLRSRDAPVFGSDVSLQKARTAALFSSSAAAGTLATPGMDARYISLVGGLNTVDTIDLSDYVSSVQSFLGLPTALTDGAVAFSDRAGGNLSRPFFPDGIDTADPGPFSKPSGKWSPFSTGLQLDLVINGVIQHVLFAAGAIVTDTPQSCGGITHASLGTFSTVGFTHKRLANGIQIFPGSAPIYRDNVLVGGIGVSGDGIEQDDMIAFLAIHRAGARLSVNPINNAPEHMRADTLTPQGTRLRYIQCPQAPFLGSDEQQPCTGK